MVPDLVTYNALISACEKSEQWQQACDIWPAMQQKQLMVFDVINFIFINIQHTNKDLGDENIFVKTTVP